VGFVVDKLATSLPLSKSPYIKNCPLPGHPSIQLEWGYTSHSFYTTAVDGEWSASSPGRFTPGERAHGTP